MHSRLHQFLYLLILSSTMNGCLKREGDWPMADYSSDNATFFGGSGFSVNGEPGYGKLRTGTGGRGIWNLYIEIEGDGVYFLPEVTEEVISRYFDKKEYMSEHVDYYGSAHHSSFSFQDGKLISAAISAYSCAPLNQDPAWSVKFSRNKEGPFVKLPLSRDELVAAFGEPDEWSSYSDVRTP